MSSIFFNFVDLQWFLVGYRIKWMKKFPYLLVSHLLALTLVSTSRVLAAPVPLIKIDQPIDGQVVESYVVDLKFSLKNFTLKDYKALPKNKPNEGHLHIWLDVDSPNRDNVRMSFKNDIYTFADVTPGKHTLVVELANNDHSSFDPQIIQTIKFETKAPLGSEAAPLKPGDAPKVAVSKSGEVPVTGMPGSNGFPLTYLGLGGAFLLFGILGIIILKRKSTPQL